jgi:hypothetical protein
MHENVKVMVMLQNAFIGMVAPADDEPYVESKSTKKQNLQDPLVRRAGQGAVLFKYSKYLFICYFVN